MTDDAGRTHVWELFRAAPPPLGFDPGAIGVPGWDGPTAPGFVVARLDPWRVQVRRVRPGVGVELRRWRAAEAERTHAVLRPTIRPPAATAHGAASSGSLPHVTEKDSHIVLRFLAAPTDAGYCGSVSGGRVLEWIDKAGYAWRSGGAARYCVTAYVGNVRFTRPVGLGDLVEATARLVHTGRTSMHILVTSRPGRPRRPELRRPPVPDGLRGGRRRRPPDPGPPLVPAPTTEDLAERRPPSGEIDVRAEIEAAMEGADLHRGGHRAERVLRFLAAPTDVNWGGKVHGGIVMRWIDEAAHVLAHPVDRRRRQRRGLRRRRAVLPAAADRAPRRGRGAAAATPAARACTCRVHVRSGDPPDLERRLTTHCLIVFVALDRGSAVGAGAAVEAGDGGGRRARRARPAPDRAAGTRGPAGPGAAPRRAVAGVRAPEALPFRQRDVPDDRRGSRVDTMSDHDTRSDHDAPVDERFTARPSYGPPRPRRLRGSRRCRAPACRGSLHAPRSPAARPAGRDARHRSSRPGRARSPRPAHRSAAAMSAPARSARAACARCHGPRSASLASGPQSRPAPRSSPCRRRWSPAGPASSAPT